MKSSFILCGLFAALGAMAHPGGLDANGGHIDRKTGVYHFHRGTNTPSATNAISPSSAPAETEVLPTEMETNAVVSPAAYAESPPGFRWGQLPWWVYLLGLGCVYLLWEIANFFWQKRKPPGNANPPTA